ncbi:MAG: ankyrin repeat domain-containing protein [Candidatus Peribacteria bacterium]|nr:MAG: ankyrin repeat domain-containing protein [Candidatus Peribacteria bacterium]
MGVDAVKLLLEAGADVNRYAPESLLTKAVKKGDKDIIRLLLEYGIDVNVKDLGGGSPLIAAVEQ